MAFFYALTQNLLSPAILFFVLGIAASFFKSDLEVPDSISRFLSIYLMMSIGFAGGSELSDASNLNLQVIETICAGIAVGFLLPFLAYGLLRFTTTLDNPTAAAVAAHYGSISVVTFSTTTAFLKTNSVTYGGYIVATLALMEGPAILSGLFIARKTTPRTETHQEQDKKVLREIFTNSAILLLFGSFVIGWLTGQSGMEKMEGFIVTPFRGILALFLLDMGLLVSKNLHHLKAFTWPLGLFGIYMPLIGAAVGLGLSWLIGLDVGTGTLFIVLCASASYIAVPAAMRLALPEAKAAIYLPMSLAITFPFNVVLGIPLYHMMARQILSNH